MYICLFDHHLSFSILISPYVSRYLCFCHFLSVYLSASLSLVSRPLTHFLTPSLYAAFSVPCLLTCFLPPPFLLTPLSMEPLSYISCVSFIYIRLP